MNYRLFLFVLTCCTGVSSAHGPPEQVLAFPGEDVILPCSYSSNDLPTVEWSREDLQPNVVFLYRDGCEMHEMKNPAFEYRTSLIMKELKNRNISLRISNVRLSDAGKYQCMRLWKNAPRDVTTVELVVRAVSEPKLSVVSAESGGVTLQCEANCWLPAPEIRFLDDQGNNIPADEPKRDQHASGCYSVTRRLTLPDATKRVTCRVHQPEINQTRTTEILIPAVDCMRSCLLITCFTVGAAGLLLLALCGLAVWLWKKCGKSAEGHLPVSRQSSDQSTMSGTSENQLLLKSARADDVGNSAIEKLTRDVADLKSKLHEKEETILQLQNDLKSQLSPVVCQLGQPTLVCSPSKCSPDIPKPFSPPSNHSPRATNLPNDHDPKPMASTTGNPLVSGNLPQNKGPKPGILRQNSNPAPSHSFHRKRRINSSPALFNVAASSSTSSNTSKKKLGNIGRSVSVSYARAGPNVPKLQQRPSSVFLPPSSSDNRFALLSNLSEESE